MNITKISHKTQEIPGEVTNEQLLARIKDRDETALEELYSRHAPMLRGIVGKIVRGEWDIDDIVQDVLLEFWNRAANFSEEKGPALAWMVMVARHRAIDSLRKKQVRARAEERMRQEPLNTAYQHTCEEANSNDLRHIFNKVLDRLPEAQREAIRLAYYRDLSQREITARTGIPLGTLKTRLRLALRKIQAEVLAFNDSGRWMPRQSAG